MKEKCEVKPSPVDLVQKLGVPVNEAERYLRTLSKAIGENGRSGRLSEYLTFKIEQKNKDRLPL